MLLKMRRGRFVAWLGFFGCIGVLLSGLGAGAVRVLVSGAGVLGQAGVASVATIVEDV
jgi:hypothetical protein